jgi:hypothetical protein
MKLMKLPIRDLYLGAAAFIRKSFCIILNVDS